MDMNYIYLLQFLMVIVILLGLYHFSAQMPKQHFVLITIYAPTVNQTYSRFECTLLQEDVVAFEKYDIWRFIEKTKESLIFP